MNEATLAEVRERSQKALEQADWPILALAADRDLLLSEVDRLRGLISGLSDRVAAQSSPFQGLNVNGLDATDLHLYSLRWTNTAEPVLYFQGKRVTQPWRLRMDWVGTGTNDGSANTAG